jgi:RNA polymerase sigma factor (sigma-70 family)
VEEVTRRRFLQAMSPSSSVERAVVSASGHDTDATLIASVLGGDDESYGMLVKRHQAIAHRTAWVLGAGADTEDVVQDAFVKAYRALHRFRQDQPFVPWLLTIVANEARNRSRWFSRHRTVSLSLIGDVDPGGTSPGPQQIAEDQETTRALRDALQALPVAQREVVTCRYLLELTERETAQVLGVPAGTVKSRLSRGLGMLSRALELGLGRTTYGMERGDG